MIQTNAFANRTLGQFPLSIATSLALEGAMGIHPEQIKQTQTLQDYSVIWFNVKTLFRNIYNAISKEEIQTIDPNTMTEGLLQEIDQLVEVIREQTQDRCRCVFYLCDYAGMELSYPKAMIRGDSTTLQKYYTGLMIASIAPIVKNQPDFFKTYRLKITDRETKPCLLMTHFPLDLTSKTFTKKSLLESHTGAIKLPHQWYTKYYHGKELGNIPFREDFLTIFGDNEQFRPMSLPIRRGLIELADQYNWSQVTTRARIIQCLDLMKNKYFSDTIKSFMKAIP